MTPPSAIHPGSLAELLLPRPRSIRMREGFFAAHPAEPVRLCVEAAVRNSIEPATEALAGAFRKYANATILLDSPERTGLKQPCVAIGRPDRGRHDESYTLDITPRRIEIAGKGNPGLFYGIQTLIQILRAGAGGPGIPCLRIQDEPSFKHRGYYLDISRGKVPTLATLKRMADRLCALKINQFQLYVEHVFDFKFDPSIARGCCPLRPAEIVELDRYCHERFIELVPSLATIGHMGRVLSLPQYRRLAEVPWPAQDWESASWLQRLRGATLNPLHPGSRKLLQCMCDEFLPLFRSSRFTICGDETYDLGQGANAGLAARRGVDYLYVRHLRFMRKLAQAHGKRIMFWGDVMLHHPASISRIPGDCTVLDWGYEPTTPFRKTHAFIEAGLDAYVCPSVRGYKTVFNDIEAARLNISGYARAGYEMGATGLLNTDWGDRGHFNLAPCSYHGMALGAALAWNARANYSAGLDRAFSFVFFNDRTGRAATLYSAAGSTGLSPWPIYPAAPDQIPTDPRSLKQAARVAREAPRWRQAFLGYEDTDFAGAIERRQLAVACEFLRVNAETLLLTKTRASARRRDRAQRMIMNLRDLEQDYAEIWNAVNRPCGLDDLRHRAFQPARKWLRQQG